MCELWNSSDGDGKLYATKCLYLSKVLINLMTPRSNWLLISPDIITSEWNMKVIRKYRHALHARVHFKTYRALRYRSSASSFHDYLHYCAIFLAHFLIKINLNIISSLYIVFSLCARVGWCDVCTDFTNVIKVDVDVDVNEISLLNI